MLRLCSRLPLVGLLVATTACSFTTFERESCDSHAPCRDAFGLGFVCGADGYCGRAPAHPRCAQAYPDTLLSDPESLVQPFVYGNLMDRSLDTHVAREKSARLAAKQVNNVGGLEGKALAMLFCNIEQNYTTDGLSRTEAAVDTARYLVETYGVPGIVGPASSGDTAAVFEAVRHTDVVMITPSGTSPLLFEIDEVTPTDENPGHLWRTPPSDALQGAVIAADMMERRITTVAVVHETGPYGTELANVFKTAYVADRDDTYTATIYSYGEGSDDELAKAAACAGDPTGTDCVDAPQPQEVLFISSQTSDASYFMQLAAADPNFDAVSIFVTDAAANQDFLDEVAGASDQLAQLRGTRPTPLGPESFVYPQFTESYRNEYDGEDVTAFSFTAHAFDAAWLLFYATAWSSFQPPGEHGIAPGLRQVSAPGIHTDDQIQLREDKWLSAVNAFRSGTAIDVRGASGELDFEPDTEETSAPVDVWIVGTDGSIETVATHHPDS